MKFSEIWLREWVALSINSNTLYDQLTMAGFQVEESKPVYKYKFSDVVVGAVVEYTAYPGLIDKWIIKINNGSKKLINVICDRINFYKDLKVVVATIGAVLPNDSIVTTTAINYENSEGILCTYKMLKLYDYTENIIILPKNAPIGVNFYDYLGLNDNIISINVTPNRGDCFNILGLSREIAAINQLKLKKLQLNTIIPTINDTLPIIIENPKQCPKFLGRIIKNINISVGAPLKIREKLRRCGIHSVNVVTDIINYVLLELGYPIYAFDYDKIDPNTICIRYANFGETLKLFEDNIVTKLHENTLIVADCYKPLAIAGLIVGNEFNVSIRTRNIFLKSAFFESSIIIKQSKLYNIYTNSSIQYEHGVDLNLSELALNYVTYLLLKICNGCAGPITSYINNRFLPKSNFIRLHMSKLDKLLGFHIKNQEIIFILRNLGFRIIKIQNNIWTILVPTWRFDIFVEEDLISEIIRIYGYNKIPQIPMIHSSIAELYSQSVIDLLFRSKIALVDRGYHEIITYSFVNPNIQKLLYPQHVPLTLMNPISLNMSVMRLSLWTGLIKTAIYNQNRQQKCILLFESGICFMPKKNNLYRKSQTLMISGIRAGFKFYKHWDATVSVMDFYDIKGDVEAILYSIIHISNNNNIIFKSYQHSALHPKQSAAIYLNEIFIGYIGKIHPMIQYKLGLYLDTLLFELSWDVISEFQLTKSVTDVSKFPKNYRDISFIIQNDINAADIINLCKEMDIEQLIDVKLIDVYTGKNISKGYKGFTIKLILQSNTHTLKEKEISKIIDKCILVLKKQFNIILR